MTGALLTEHVDFEKIEIRNDIPVPLPGRGEVLVKVAATGINNTDTNTRIGWYSKSVTRATSDGGVEGYDITNENDASWSGVALIFPRIKGADCCGRIVAVGEGVNLDRIGEQVLVRNMLRSYVDYLPWKCSGLSGRNVTEPSRNMPRRLRGEHTGSTAIGAMSNWLRCPAPIRPQRVWFTGRR
ncbi:alcohol dehydrogenase catalytic domain-containing protein [Paenirhodobacter sp.]|uniref:alcohol dehydrogenase catalytic domain-containing protein n=1 Tax=Paenirhodobacter sp. TaxID=1965326 RepID=UPI003B503DF9